MSMKWNPYKSALWLALLVVAFVALSACGPVSPAVAPSPTSPAAPLPTATPAASPLATPTSALPVSPVASPTTEAALTPARTAISAAETVTSVVGAASAPDLSGPVATITSAPTASTPITGQASATAAGTAVSQAAATGGAATGAVEKVVMTLDWVPNTNHSGVYVALDKGWYRDQGLDIEIQIPSDPAAALKQVATGHTQFGVSFQEELTLARSQGIPIVSIAAVIQHNTSAFASLKGSGITSPKAFEGKRYASYGTVLERPVIQGLMTCDGADVNKVEFVDVGFDAFPALVGHRVDFIWIFQAWDGVRAELMGNQLDTVPVSGGCVPDYYTPVLMAGETTIAQRPETVRKFLAATARGYEYAVQNPAEAAEILIKHSPESDPELVRRSQAWLSPRYRDDVPVWGVQKAEIWKGLSDWMAKNNLLQGQFDSSRAFTNEFLPKQ